MRLLVCGSRDWSDHHIIFRMLDGYLANYGTRLILIEGGCPTGADAHARNWVKQVRAPIQHHRFDADWKTFGKRAGPLRNRRMIDEGHPDLVLAFHDNITQSKGTKDMVQVATQRSIRTYVIASAWKPEEPLPLG